MRGISWRGKIFSLYSGQLIVLPPLVLTFFLLLVSHAGESYIPIKNYASYSSASILGHWGVLCRHHPIAFRISFGGEFYLSKLAHLILWFFLFGSWTTLQSSSFLPSASHPEKTVYLSRISHLTRRTSLANRIHSYSGRVSYPGQFLYSAVLILLPLVCRAGEIVHLSGLVHSILPTVEGEFYAKTSYMNRRRAQPMSAYLIV